MILPIPDIINITNLDIKEVNFITLYGIHTVSDVTIIHVDIVKILLQDVRKGEDFEIYLVVLYGAVNRT